MLSVLPRAFVYSDIRDESGEISIHFTPDPAFQPQSLEERVLHGMSGTVWVDDRTMRLHRVEGRLGEDVSIGFGLLATIRAGSNFDTQRDPFQGGEWKTTLIDTDINGKAIFFKAIAPKAAHRAQRLCPCPGRDLRSPRQSPSPKTSPSPARLASSRAGVHPPSR